MLQLAAFLQGFVDVGGDIDVFLLRVNISIKREPTTQTTDQDFVALDYL